MDIVQRKLKDIKPYEKNPRKNDKAVEYVANSIRQFGFKVPIIIDKDGVIIAGHTRYKACKRLKMKEVPCVIADDLSEEEVKAFRLADNKVSEIAEWDMPQLDVELDGILDIDMADFGFELGELAEPEVAEDDEFADIEKLEKHYGVPYQGNKSRIADRIISILPEGKRLVDLFGGGVR